MRREGRARGKLLSGRKIVTWRRLGVLAGVIVAAWFGYLAFEAKVAREFETRDADVPTRVLARPLVLRPGDRHERRHIVEYLTRVGYRSVSSRFPRSGEFRLRGRELRIGRRPLRMGRLFDAGGFARVRFSGYGRVDRIASIQDSEGKNLPALLLDPELLHSVLGARNRDRVAVPLGDVPDHLVDALLTVEDRRFYEHGPLDFRRIAGAALSNLRQGRIAEGGSTITQQLARTLFLSGDRTVLRKVREALAAVALERRFSKQRLLEAYVNHIYLGQDGGAAIHGFARAAQHYFDRDVSELTLGQSAMLAGIIRGPSLFAPHRHPARARTRRNVVLRQMHAVGHIDADRLAAELEADLVVRPRRTRKIDARWYLDFVRRELASGAQPVGVDGAGLTVMTTLEPAVQRVAERVVSEGLRKIERRHPGLAEREQPLQAALVAIDPRTGGVLAMVGGRSYGASQFNRAADARRQPGSAFKPIVALAALDPSADAPFTLASLLDDEPLELETPAGVWRPANADREFVGPIKLRDALEESRNVPFARLGLEVGPERIIDTARRLGVESRLLPYPSLALGASEVTLLELTAAYAVLAAEGRRAPPRTVLAVLDRSGHAAGDRRLRSESVLTAGEAYLVTSALRGVVQEGTGSGVFEAGYTGPVAAKSGTTNGTRDAWFVGYTPELAVGVWVGFDDGARTGLSGSRAALPIFTDFLIGVLGPDGGREFRFPAGVEWVDVEPGTGRRAGWGCRGEPELFLVGTAPRNYCGYRPDPWGRRTLFGRASGRGRVDGHVAPGGIRRAEATLPRRPDRPPLRSAHRGGVPYLPSNR